MRNNKKGFYPDYYFSLQPDIFELQLGYGLIPLVSAEKNVPLLDEITFLREKIDYEFGICIPTIHIRDNMTLDSNDYAICLLWNTVAKGNIRMGYNLFIDTGTVAASEKEVKAEKITEPVMGKTAYWVLKEDREESEKLENSGFIKVLPEEEIRIHLYKIITENLTKILNQSMVNTLINKVRPTNPDVIDDIFFNHQFPTSSMKKILNRLLAERYSIRDMNTILEAIADNISQSTEPEFLVKKIKKQLSAPIEKKGYYEL
ncbi:MAG: FHIPEP family type III secretion protein [Treponema sp.]|nr:FHIPEP family type III secretion protein [Treponema sp.]